MLDTLLKEGIKQLTSALVHKKHPFRYFTFTTVSQDGSPHSRTVVLRGFDPEKFIFSIYTDSRSEKIKELNHDQRAEFLFYDPNQLLQLSVKANLVHTKASKEKFESLPEPSKKDYSSVQFPGTFVKAPDSIQYDFEKGHFVELHFVASQFEYLKLKRPNHLRARFYAERAWEGEFLAP
jgi:hypothetical protein